MQYLEDFDEDNMDTVDVWIQQNNADISKVKSVSYKKVKTELSEDYTEE